MHIRKTKDGWRVGRTTVQKQEKSMRVCGRGVIANYCCAQNVKTGFMADMRK